MIRIPANVRAALIHFCTSAIFALGVGLIAFGFMYPAPLSAAVGLWGIYLLLVSVDVIIGPLLTLLVYRVGKTSLKFDLAVIVFIQSIAFFYGSAQIIQGRPVWIVFNIDRFDVVQAMDVDRRREAEANQAFVHAPWWGPEIIAAKNPIDFQKRNELMFESAQGGPDLPQRLDLYVPLSAEAASITARSSSLEKLLEFNSASSVKKVLAEWPEANAWLPANAKNKSMTVLINKDSARVVAIVDLRPWQDI